MPARKLHAVEGGRATPRKRKPAAEPAKTPAPAKKRGRPVSRLSSTLAEGTSERDMLVVLRAKLANQVDNGPAHAFDRNVRQFLQVDGKIRAIDAREAEAAEQEGDEDDEYDEEFDPSQL